MAKVVCPYCQDAFPQRRVRFRCLAQLADPRTGRRCEVQLDEPLAAYIGAEAPATLGPVFAADGSRRRATCPACGIETFTRLCPTCHNELPAEFADSRAHFIALIGAKDSGKSTYITVLIHELRNRVGAGFGASVEAMDDRTIRRYAERFEKVLYRDGVMLPPTQPASVDINYPLLYRYQARRRTMFGERPHSSSLVFFDTAGEDLGARPSIETHVRYLAQARGIILLVDPLQIEGIRAALGGSADALPLQGMPPDELMANVTQLLRSRNGTSTIRTPLAVAFSKVDALWDLVPEGSRLLQRGSQADGFDDADRRELDDEIRALLERWEGGRLARHVDLNYADASFFGLSALGAAPAGAKVPAHGISPFRVEDPVLWLLAKAGIVPTRARAR